jgi:hypothetical protein
MKNKKHRKDHNLFSVAESTHREYPFHIQEPLLIASLEHLVLKIGRKCRNLHNSGEPPSPIKNFHSARGNFLRLEQKDNQQGRAFSWRAQFGESCSEKRAA